MNKCIRVDSSWSQAAKTCTLHSNNCIKAAASWYRVNNNWYKELHSYPPDKKSLLLVYSNSIPNYPKQPLEEPNLRMVQVN